MKKVLILSYFFPPCNLTASQRSYSWSKYLKENDYYPIIVTRRWDHKVNKLSDVSKATPNDLLHEKNENGETYYLPYQPNLKDRIYAQHGDEKHVLLRRLLTFVELLFQGFSNSLIQYRNVYTFCRSYLKENPDVKLMVVTGNPFNLFKFGYLLHKEFGLKWIADYRDAWTTSEINMINKGFVFKLINKLDTIFEKKWVGSASLVTASSQPIANHVSNLVNVEGKALYNGFVKEDFEDIMADAFDKFTVTYVGTLYDGQQVEIFCEALIKLIDHTNSTEIKFLLPGLAFYPNQTERIAKALAGYESYYECTERMKRNKILAMEKSSQVLLHVAWKGFQGIIASKIYEYIASGSFILVTPSDNGSIQQIVEGSACGKVTETVEETFEVLLEMWDKYQAGEEITNNLNKPEVEQYSRQLQVKKLAGFLDKLPGSLMAFKNLILFAGGQPFRDLHTFLKTEMAYLSPKFEQIYVLVNSREAPALNLPDNVHLEGINIQLSQTEKWFGLFKLGHSEIQKELKFYVSQSPKKTQALKSIFNQFNAAEEYAEELLDFMQRHKLGIEDNSTLLYSYWTDYRTIALALLKKERPKLKFICRMHGWDLYRERHEEKYLPFRKFISQQANSIFFISNNGKQYAEKMLQEKLPQAKVNYLGTQDFGHNPKKSKEVLKLVSCSFSVSLKRVELIAYALSEIDQIEIEWTHIGSGPSQSYFEKEINRVLADKANIQYKLLGLISNEKVIKLYQIEHFDLFINTSEFEGIPIGMMEAMSFGIPCLGTDTGGVNEIITDNENGFLVAQYPKAKDIAEKIECFQKLNDKEEFRKAARLTWENDFNADKNYESFIEDILTVRIEKSK